jgi:hypothetical protein
MLRMDYQISYAPKAAITFPTCVHVPIFDLYNASLYLAVFHVHAAVLRLSAP